MMSFNPIYFSSPICTISDIIPRKMESQILIKHEEGSSLLASINQLPQSLIEHEEELQFMEVKIEDIPIVLVHNPSTCEVISFKDEIEKKSNQLNEADDLICLVDGSINHLNDYQICERPNYFISDVD